ncbi:MAG: hypothetical protein NVSMB32_09730 [Actinomycetota bacterium]
MHLRNRLKTQVARVAIVGVTAGLLAPALMGPAHADYAPGGYASSNGQGDVIGVGSDTLQFLLDFGADGDHVADSGVNANQKSKLVNFDATADSNARLAYQNNGVGVTPTALDPTIVLRAGTVPAQRPNGSGPGYAALVADTTTTVINYVRGSRLPNGSEVQTAINNGWTGLQTVQIATETLTMAVPTVHNAVPLSTAQLNKVYTCAPGATTWNGAVISGTATSTIIPVLPQPGSGTRSTFLKDIGLTDPQVTGLPCIKISEENDPLAISALGPDAIGPMSSSRLNMFNGVAGNGGPVGAPGYFYDPHHAYGKNPYPGGALEAPGAVLLTGNTNETPARPAYRDDRGLYVAFRASDIPALNGKGWKVAGAGQSWIQQLFLDSTAADGIGTPFFATSGLATSSAAGAVASGTAANPIAPGTPPNYFNCGNGTPVNAGVATFPANCKNNVIP